MSLSSLLGQIVALLAEGVDRNQWSVDHRIHAEHVALLAEGVDRNSCARNRQSTGRTSPSSRRAWIEIEELSRPTQGRTSPSSRRAWIEIGWYRSAGTSRWVALLAEGVDRNSCPAIRPWHWKVALLAEGVDRNSYLSRWLGADRASPSSRRAWIEINSRSLRSRSSSVALLAEGVDRNPSGRSAHALHRASPSSRRAWIEMQCWR